MLAYVGRSGRVTVAVAGWLALHALVGCPPCGPIVVFAEDFEQCDGPCGWDVELGEVVRVETVHSSQHALQLSPGTILSRRLGIDHEDPYPLAIGLVSDCAASLVGVTVELSAEGNTWTQEIPLERCGGEPAGIRDERPPYQELCGELERKDGLETAQGIVLERIQITSAVACVVDGILLSHRAEGC